MARYIDAEALVAELQKKPIHDGHFIHTRDVSDAIFYAPTISPDDVRGVGHLVGIDDFPHESWECDRCGCVVENIDDPWNYFHYCHNCGARMTSAEAEKAMEGEKT